MICTICGEDSARVYHRKTGDRELSLTLCPDCYARLYPEGEGADFFASFLGRTAGRRKTCPTCGVSLDDYRRTGLVGCADCYTYFRAELMETVRMIQGKSRHAGKVPEGTNEKRYELFRRQVELRERIKEAQDAHDAAEEERLRSELDGVTRALGEVE